MNDRDFAERVPSLDRDGRRAYRFETDGRDLTAVIVEAVAEVADCNPVEDGFRLYDAVDPDALERLVGDGPGQFDGEVVFELRGCRVTARSGRSLVVHEPPEGWDDSRTPSPESA